MNEWIKCSDLLPPEGAYVVGHYNGGNHIDSGDQFGCECNVVRIVRGISMSERTLLRDGDFRKIEYKSCDEYGNNRVPYCWDTFGPASYFGQDIDMWMPITRP